MAMIRQTTRLPPEVLTELERLRRALNADNPHLRLTMSDMIRMAVELLIHELKILSWQRRSFKLGRRAQPDPPEAGR